AEGGACAGRGYPPRPAQSGLVVRTLPAHSATRRGRTSAGARGRPRLAQICEGAAGGRNPIEVRARFVMSIDQRDRPGNGSSPSVRPTTAAELSATVRDRLIESRLTPNAISMVGLVGNLAAAALIWQGYYTLGGIAFIIGSVMDTLDGRYARASGKGTLFGAFLDSTLDRIEEGLVLTAVAYRFALSGDE